MKCPLTYKEAGDGRRYSKAGLHHFARRLLDLQDLPYTAAEQRHEAVQRAGKMSIQGVQPKLSAILHVAKQAFQVVDTGGKYILKPQHVTYPELPENEDLSMYLASAARVPTSTHGLIYAKDRSLTYVIKRFDRASGGKKFALEDFAQLSGKDRDTKYDSSMEQVAQILDLCTFPIPERLKLLRLTTVNFLVGNEDAHLKNFSLITKEDKIELSPAYDVLNTTIALSTQEEIALPLGGRKKELTRKLLFEYFGQNRLGLNEQAIFSMLEQIRRVFPAWIELVNRSFLSDSMKRKYLHLFEERRARLGL